VGDLYRDAARKPLLERRYGVAIDRITGAVAQGPFELEVLTDALFCGQIGLRNFTIGQFGLLAAALLDMGEGLVPVGYGKSRGLGRIEIEFGAITFRALRDPGGRLLGVGVLATDTDRASYNLPAQETDWLDMPGDNGQRGPFFTRTTGGAAAQDWLNTASARWLPEVRP
jgi:CRISPR/Cas system CSM-associated protein Csm3 (group 7 of RAMP superfamily)